MVVKRIIGFDASFTTIGIAVIDYEDDLLNLIYSGFYKPPGSGNLFERLSHVRKHIIKLLRKYKPDEVVLEDIIKFMRGKSNAHTITLLSALNRTVGLAVFETLKRPPYLVSAIDVRDIIKNGNKIPSKEEVPDLVSSILDIDFNYIIGKRGAIKDESYDIADAIACALCYVITDMSGGKLLHEPKRISKRKKSKKRIKKRKKR